MKHILLLSGSMSPTSFSARLLLIAEQKLKQKGYKTTYIDLRKSDIPFCDGRDLEKYPEHISDIFQKISSCDGVIFGMPVYCYSFSGALKNCIDIFSRAFTGKYFGICSAAGSKLSYLATADLLKVMNFEVKSLGILPIVMSDPKDFDAQGILSESVDQRIDAMIEVLGEKV